MGILKGCHSPLTPNDIYIRLEESGLSVSLSTVYRNLEMLVSKNFVVKSCMSDGRTRYELNRMDHRHHMVCMGCSKTVSINDCPFGKLEKRIRESTDFDVTGHRLEVYGYCPNCKSKK